MPERWIRVDERSGSQPAPPIPDDQPAVTVRRSCRATMALAPGFRFCPERGARLGESDCKACGIAVRPGASFCPGCGATR